MNKKILGLMMIVSASAFASPQPLENDVQLRNSKFTETIYKALEAKVPAVAERDHMRTTTRLTIENMITCHKSVVFDTRAGKPETTFGCSILKKGWRSMGNEMYGSGFKQTLTKKLYDSLDLKVVKDEGMSFKTIELNVREQNGGTQRNMLVCTRVGKKAEELGLRDTCDVLNAL